MGVTIQFESHTCELPVIYKLEYPQEYDREYIDVREYYDQPYRFTLEYKNEKGRKVWVTYTPDFFVVSDTTLEFIECKTEEELHVLAKKKPWMYKLGKDGRWHCPPAEKALKAYGFRHKIISSAEIDRTLYNNILFIEDYLDINTPPVSSAMRDMVATMVGNVGCITLAELLDLTLRAGGTADDIYTLIATGGLYVDLTAESFNERKYVRVYLNQEAVELYHPSDRYFEYAKTRYVVAQEGTRVALDNRILRIVLVAESKVYMEGEDGTEPCLSLSHFERLIRDGVIRCLDFDEVYDREREALTLINSATKKAIEKANRIRRVLGCHFNGEPLPEQVPERTLARWKARWLTGQRVYGSGYAGVVFNYAGRGDRRTVKIDPSVRAEMERLIEVDYENEIAQDMFAVWSELVAWCNKQTPKLLAPHYVTFIRYIKKRPAHLQALKRLGHRAAYVHQPFYLWLEKDTPPHGCRPFEIAHIDHTELDIELVDPETCENLGRPWLTLMIDAFSRRFLAVFITFDPPSYRSNMMVIRECVRRWGRLPQTIVVDGGSDFHSVYFEMLAAAFEITIKTRPRHEPRFGSLVERVVNTTHAELIHLLRGNTKIRRNVRQVSRSHDPSRLAAWTMEMLDESLCDWAYNRYDTDRHWTLKRSPRDIFESTLNLTGERRHRALAYDREFLILTMPSTRKMTARVQNGGRVKVDGDYYECHELGAVSVGTDVEVRFDPYNILYGYVRLKNRWVQCMCRRYLCLERRTERERKIYSVEERKRKRLYSESLTDRAIKRALESEKDKVKEGNLVAARKEAQARKRDNGHPLRRILGNLFHEFNPQPEAMARVDSPEGADTPTSGRSLFADIDTSSIRSLEEYTG
jgi:putative transposase